MHSQAASGGAAQRPGVGAHREGLRRGEALCLGRLRAEEGGDEDQPAAGVGGQEEGKKDYVEESPASCHLSPTATSILPNCYR